MYGSILFNVSILSDNPSREGARGGEIYIISSVCEFTGYAILLHALPSCREVEYCFRSSIAKLRFELMLGYFALKKQKQTKNHSLGFHYLSMLVFTLYDQCCKRKGINFLTTTQNLRRSMAQPQKRTTNVDDQENSEFIGLHLYCMFDYTCEHHHVKSRKLVRCIMVHLNNGTGV